MKMTKKINSFIAALLLVVVRNICSDPFPIDLLPRDMQEEVMIKMASNMMRNLPESPESLKIAAKEIKKLCMTNKELYKIINQPKFTLKLIKNFAKTFHCNDEIVAEALGIKGAQERIELQEELSEFIRSETFSMDKFEELCKRGADLEFVNGFQEIPLELAAFAADSVAVQALINKGVNVNQVFGSENNNVLSELIDMIQHIKGDELNKWIIIIKMLLDAGANPTFSVNGQATALEKAQRYGQKEVVKLFYSTAAVKF